MKHFTILAILLAVTFMFGCGPVVKSDLETVQEKGTLIVGVKGDTPPFGFVDKDGNHYGFDVDLSRKIARKLGVNIEYVSLTTAERIPALLEGQVDMLAACMTITRERERSIDYCMPYFETHQSLLVRKDSPITDYLDLAGKKVGAAASSTGMAMLKIVQPDAEIVSFNSYADAFEPLRKGEIDAVATDHIILVGMLAGKEDDFKIVGSFGWDPYGFAVRENESDLREKINEALQDLWDEGAYQQLYDSWLGEHSRFPTGSMFTITTFPRGNLK